MSDYLDGIDAAADWQPEGGAAEDHGNDVDRAWSMAACLCKMHRYHLAAYLRWKNAYARACVLRPSWAAI